MADGDPGSSDRDPVGVVGLVGAGQLARMTCEIASALDLPTVVLAEGEDASAVEVAPRVLFGSPDSADDLQALADQVGVMTFDHELVDLEVIRALERAGHRVRPGSTTLAMAIDKAEMRRTLSAAGIPVPAFEVLPEPPEAVEQALAAFAARHRWPLVLKTARGGYDGRGVWVVDDMDRALDTVRIVRRGGRRGAVLLVEEHVRLQTELAVMVARSPSGQVAIWPPAETTQVDGVCREILVPGALSPEVAREAQAIGMGVAELVGAVGVLAVELFWTGRQLLVNELAARPHNSGHWTIEGSVTSQFENHLRAVLDLPLGRTEARSEHVATVNVLGGNDATDPRRRLSGALAVPGAHVHLYGKEPRPGRKLGHVTVCGADAGEVAASAWAAATALGTSRPESASGPIPPSAVPGERPAARPAEPPDPRAGPMHAGSVQ